MKNILLFLIATTIFSCKNTENENLKKRISELEQLNKKYSDSLIKKESKDITSNDIIFFPASTPFKPSKKNVITGVIYKYYKVHLFDVYQYEDQKSLDDRDRTKAKLILKNQTNSKFKIEFLPKSKNDTILYLGTVFIGKDSSVYEFPRKINLNDFK